MEDESNKSTVRKTDHTFARSKRRLRELFKSGQVLTVHDIFPHDIMEKIRKRSLNVFTCVVDDSTNAQVAHISPSLCFELSAGQLTVFRTEIEIKSVICKFEPEEFEFNRCNKHSKLANGLQLFFMERAFLR